MIRFYLNKRVGRIFKKGIIKKVNNHRIPKKVTYDIKLDKKFKNKFIYKNVLSNRLKKYEEKEDEDIISELEELVKLKKEKGSNAMKKKFDELCKAKEKKEIKRKKLKEKKQKEKIF